jgi:nitrite reductase/ring-hydroxylating ferredoxin subunit
MLSSFVKVAKTTDLLDGQMKMVTVRYMPILLVRIDGEFFAIDDLCSHAGGSLHSGVMAGQEVACPLHGARFDIKTGRQSIGPSGTDQKVYHLRVEGDDIYLGPPATAR